MTTGDSGRFTWYRGRKILVTGGLGFIGLNLSLRLRDLGAEVTVMDNFVSPDVSHILGTVCAGIAVAVADIRDAEKVERVVRNQEVIFNLAGKSGAADSNNAPLIDLDINCRGHLTLLDACRRVNPDVAVIFPSSRLVYGKPHRLPVDEDHPLEPESIYAAHKLAVENYHFIYGHLYGLRSTVLRISNPYGPFQIGDARIYGIANRFIQAAARGEKITLFGEGSQLRDYLYIDDLTDALLSAGCTPGAVGRIYNIGEGNGVTILQLAELAVKTAGRGEIVMTPWPKEYESIETGDYVSDIRRAETELGWRPATSLEAGVRATVDSYRIQAPLR